MGEEPVYRSSDIAGWFVGLAGLFSPLSDRLFPRIWIEAGFPDLYL
ncbi:hypothetical protein [uncultured Parabacteroides sp.]|jgi:hypothetical protein|nr:hypothetical protein [uncultured Parabacteroides sp.]